MMNSRSIVLAASVALGGASLVLAQQTVGEPGKGQPPCQCGMMGRGAGGTGMGMGHPMGGGDRMHPVGPPEMFGLLAGDVKMEVKNAPKGVVITLTTEDAKAVGRLQKKAEVLRLMQELKREGP